MKRISNKDFVDRLYYINPNIKVLEEYVNTITKLSCQCMTCGYVWKVSPSHLLYSKSGCPKCKCVENGHKKRKSPEQFAEELNKVNRNIILLENYTTNRTKILCECVLCGNIWKGRPSDLLRGIGCPGCYASKGELVISAYLNQLGVKYYYDTPYFDDLYGISWRLLRPDFIIPDLKIWIEYDGRQHFMPVNFECNSDVEGAKSRFEKIKINDEIKNQYAIDNGWELIRISYLDYDYIETILDNYFIKESD